MINHIFKDLIFYLFFKMDEHNLIEMKILKYNYLDKIYNEYTKHIVRIYQGY